MDDIRVAWVRGYDAQEERKQLSEVLKGWWTGTGGEVFTKGHEERAEAEHGKFWYRWRWARENMRTRTLAGAPLERCPPPSGEEMRHWRGERKERQKRGSS